MLHYSEWFLPYGYTNSKWMRVHQWQPQKNRFFINNVAFYINEVEKEKVPFHYEIESSLYYYGRRIDLYFSKERSSYVKKRLDKLFEDRDFIYVAKRAPKGFKGRISPMVEFFDNLFMELGSSITWSATKSEQVKNITRTTIFPSSVMGKSREEYLEWWGELVSDFVIKNIQAVNTMKKSVNLRLEVEVFDDFIFNNLFLIRNVLLRYIQKKMSKSEYRVDLDILIEAPAAKPYKRDSLTLMVELSK